MTHIAFPSAALPFATIRTRPADARIVRRSCVHVATFDAVVQSLERIRGRAFSQLAYMRYSAVGLALFAFLLYLGLRNDLTGGNS